MNSNSNSSEDSESIAPSANSLLKKGAEVPQAALTFIFFTILLDVLSLGLLIPVLPTLIEQEFVGGDTVRAAQVAGWFATIWALMQFVFSPIMGALSDKYGRRTVILVSCVGLGLDYVLMALAPNLVWLFIGRILSGITAASFSTAAAYVADITPPEKRAAAYGMYIGAAWGIGFVLGPAIGGLLGGIDLRLPLWCAAGLTLINALYGYFILPESLPVNKRANFSWKKANPLGSLRLLRSQRELLGLATLLLIYQLAHQVFQNVFVLYGTHRYGWSSAIVGLTLTVVGVLAVVMQAYVVRRTSTGLGEWRMVLIALVTGAIGYVIYGLAPNGMVFCLAIPIFSLVGYFSPGLQALMTRRVGPESQGQLQGVNSSIMAIAGMIGPGIFTTVFAWAVRTETSWKLLGAPFLVAAVLHILAIFVFIRVCPKTQSTGLEPATTE